MLSRLPAAVIARTRSAAFRTADYAYRAELSLRGVNVGDGVRVEGRPNVQRIDGEIILHDGVTLRSRDFGYHGPIEPVRLLVDAPGARIEIGARCRINGASIHAQSSVVIGSRTLIAARTVIVDCDGHVVDERRRARGERDIAAPIFIGDDVWIGYGVIILKGVTIGDGTVVGAGSIVTRSLPARSVCAGQPARVVRALSSTHGE